MKMRLILFVFIVFYSCKEADIVEETNKDISQGIEQFKIEKELNDKNSNDALVASLHFDKNLEPNDSSNYGSYEVLWLLHWQPFAGEDLPAIARSFIQFDLTEIPTDAHIDSASLKFYPNKDLLGDQGWSSEGFHYWSDIQNDFSYFKVLSPWDENLITWDNLPATSDTAIGVYGPTKYGLEIIELNIKEVVQQWVVNPSTNYGLYLKLNDENSNTRVVVGSTESNYNPIISVQYSVKK